MISLSYFYISHSTTFLYFTPGLQIQLVHQASTDRRLQYIHDYVLSCILLNFLSPYLIKLGNGFQTLLLTSQY